MKRNHTMSVLTACLFTVARAAWAEEACSSLGINDFSQILDAPAQIIETRTVETSADAPAYCQVSGYVAPQVGFVLRLPTKNWNGKFIELGCGGFCGSTDHVSACSDPLRRGYACAVTDDGHKSLGNQALWAYNNLQAEVDHAYRAAHVTALAGKAVLERFYGRTPNRSYFIGNSTGGRQALIEAQRFPWDFDGIVAGLPSQSIAGIFMNLLWGIRSFTDETGTPLFSQADLKLLHGAVVNKCDMNDGVKDGLIGDPRLCHFDPAELLCKVEQQAACLTGTQVKAVNKIYAGAVNSRGDKIYLPAALKGSELTWIDWFSSRNFAREEFRYGAFDPDAGPTWQPKDFDFDRDYKRFGSTEGLVAAVNPDLRQFKATGAKLIAWAGWSDAAGMPLHTVDYYETTERLMGGRAATQDFFRLFMLPGVGHGWGEGAYRVDWLAYLEAWVEQGQAPDAILSAHIKIEDVIDKAKQGDPQAMRTMDDRSEFPLKSANVQFWRPVYPYPITARYAGHGDVNQATSFGPTSR